MPCALQIVEHAFRVRLPIKLLTEGIEPRTFCIPGHFVAAEPNFYNIHNNDFSVIYHGTEKKPR
jgi:hypothetical protein